MSQALLLRMDGNEAIVQLPQGGVIRTTLETPPSATANVASPVQPLACFLQLGTYNIWKKLFEKSMLHSVNPPAHPVPTPSNTRMTYKKKSRPLRPPTE